jgi:hypothetical protein
MHVVQEEQLLLVHSVDCHAYRAAHNMTETAVLLRQQFSALQEQRRQQTVAALGQTDSTGYSQAPLLSAPLPLHSAEPQESILPKPFGASLVSDCTLLASAYTPFSITLCTSLPTLLDCLSHHIVCVLASWERDRPKSCPA